MAAADRPLDGLRVLVTRPAGRAGSLIRALGRVGALAEARPTIQFEPASDLAPVERAMRDLARFDWVLFTSPTGVRQFFRERTRLRVDPAIVPRVAVVGPGTARELQAHGWEPNRVARESRAEGLARSLSGQVGPGQRLLLVRPEVARPVLAEALVAEGAEVESVVFYRTVAAEGLQELAAELVGARFDAAVFSSPSTFHRLLEAREAARGGLERLVRVAIGEVTAGAMRKADLAPHAVAAEPTDDGIVEALCRAFSG